MRSRLRQVSWVALLAILVLSALPTLSRAWAHAQADGAAWAELCTPQGVKRIAWSGADSVGKSASPELPAPGLSHLDHCPLCGLSAHAAWLPSQVVAWQPPVALREPLPLLWLHAPRPLFAWAAAQPRAPPISA